MNTRRTASLYAIFGAVVVTLGMLAGVDGLATSAPSAAQIAHATAMSNRA